MAKHLLVRGPLPSDPWVDMGPVSGEADELRVTLGNVGSAVLLQTERFPGQAEQGLMVQMKIEERKEEQRPLRLLVGFPGSGDPLGCAGTYGGLIDRGAMLLGLGGLVMDQAEKRMQLGQKRPSGMMIHGVNFEVSLELWRRSDEEVAAMRNV